MNYRHSLDRRGFLRLGTLGLLGLGWSDYLRLSHAQGAPAGQPLRDKRAIFINLGGGASHHDTFDPKPGAPAEIRGEFGVTRTNTGQQICELLPGLARCADKYTLIRSATHNLGAHSLAGQFLTTGNRPVPSLQYPSYGAVISRERPSATDVPPYVGIPDGGSGGYLGVAYGAYGVGGNPNAKDFSVRSLSLPDGFTLERLSRRRALTQALEALDAGAQKKPELLEGLDRFQEQAFAIVTSSKTREAFDIQREPGPVRDTYGRHTFGQSLLLARRLIEGGVRFVSVGFPISWDTHDKNFQRLREQHLPWLDQGLSALLLDLDRRGLLAQTVIFMTGEFGRTPKINVNAGRDHWPNVFTMLFAGGGVKAGQVIGKSDGEGAQPADRPVTPEDVAATFYHLFGIDHKTEYQTPTGRPLQIVRDGEVIPELLAQKKGR
jgi:hypothetical protein